MNLLDLGPNRITNDINKKAFAIGESQDESEIQELIKDLPPRIQVMLLFKSIAKLYMHESLEDPIFSFEDIEERPLPKLDFIREVASPFFEKEVDSFLASHKDHLSNGRIVDKVITAKVKNYEKTLDMGKRSAIYHTGCISNYFVFIGGIDTNVKLAESLLLSYPHCISPFMKFNIANFAQLQGPEALYKQIQVGERKYEVLNPEVFETTTFGPNNQKIVKPNYNSLSEQEFTQIIKNPWTGSKEIKMSVSELVQINLKLITAGCPFDQFMSYIFPKFLQHIVELK